MNLSKVAGFQVRPLGSPMCNAEITKRAAPPCVLGAVRFLQQEAREPGAGSRGLSSCFVPLGLLGHRDLNPLDFPFPRSLSRVNLCPAVGIIIPLFPKFFPRG